MVACVLVTLSRFLRAHIKIMSPSAPSSSMNYSFYLVCNDLCKAFDSVPHSHLIDVPLSLTLVYIFNGSYTYLSDQCQVVAVGGELLTLLNS